eukprot:c16538_g1_i2.p1 GENE.c16538_g1_i2~~c16538_g1_i2.p1  ORF type:complete len:742 (+),score=93.43 c16538_g1_i2:234-2228(+)
MINPNVIPNFGGLFGFPLGSTQPHHETRPQGSCDDDGPKTPQNNSKLMTIAELTKSPHHCIFSPQQPPSTNRSQEIVSAVSPVKYANCEEGQKFAVQPSNHEKDTKVEPDLPTPNIGELPGEDRIDPRPCPDATLQEQLTPTATLNQDPKIDEISRRITQTLQRLQGGTGRHIDCNPSEPCSERPFQAFVQLSIADQSGADGALTVVPGFHHYAQAYFRSCGGRQPLGGFFPLCPKLHPDLFDPQEPRDGGHNLWRVVCRIPDGWEASGLSEIRSGGRLSTKTTISRLEALANELQQGQAPQPGDYVIWDTRLVHSTGPPASYNSTSNVRQVFYCSFTPNASSVFVSQQIRVREAGLHPSWSPHTHVQLETTDYEPFPLSDSGREVYGYNDRRRSSSEMQQVSTGSVAPNLLTQRHVDFFRRYGFVVIPDAVAQSDVDLLVREIAEAVQQHAGFDLKGNLEDLTVQSLSKVTSAHGGGMLELYWLPGMERIRQSATLHTITRELLRATWGAFSRPKKHNTTTEQEKPSGCPLGTDSKTHSLISFRPTSPCEHTAGAAKDVRVYVDRTNLRIPAQILELAKTKACELAQSREAEVKEWICCDLCNRWRILPAGTHATRFAHRKRKRRRGPNKSQPKQGDFNCAMIERHCSEPEDEYDPSNSYVIE